MTNPKISVIVPIYNAEKYLQRCINSILAQTFTDFELLLIDDGSKDKSNKICDEYAKKDKRIRVYHKENGGVSSARNMGLDNAKGKLITFCDSDDWVLNDWLSSFVYGTETDADLIVSNFTYIKSNDNFKSTSSNYSDVKDRLSELDSKYTLGFLWCKCFKKEIINHYKIRFNTSYKICEDLEFILSYLLHIDHIDFIENASYCYNVTNYKDKYFKYINFNCIFKILCHVDNYFTPKEKYPYIRGKYEYGCIRELLKFYLSKNYNEALIYLKAYSKHVLLKGSECKRTLHYFIFPKHVLVSHNAFKIIAFVLRATKFHNKKFIR